jgi:large subunit ribosomal protein L21
MYAVIATGGKQHKVKEGDTLQVELLEGSPGDKVTFQPLLVVDDDGTTHFGKEIGKASVVAVLAGEKKGEKVKVFKYKPKTGYSRKTGHRQTFTVIQIEEVTLGSARIAPKKKADAAAKSNEDEAPDAADETPEAVGGAEASAE